MGFPSDDVELLGMVHGGFARHLFKVYDAVKARLDASDKPYVVCGHSLGAVTASMFALKYWVDSGKTRTPDIIVQFGSPKGFELFSTVYDETFTHVSVMNVEDPVTYMVPHCLTHKGVKLLMAPGGDFQLLGLNEQPPYLLHNVKEQFEMMRVRQHTGRLATPTEQAEYAERDAELARTYYGALDTAAATVMHMGGALGRNTLMLAMQRGSVASHTLNEYRRRLQLLPESVRDATYAYLKNEAYQKREWPPKAVAAARRSKRSAERRKRWTS